MVLMTQRSGQRMIAAVCLVTAGLLAVAAPVYAQEDSTGQTTAGPAGIGILILLMGLGALVLVGATYAVQTRSNQEGSSHQASHIEED